MLSVSLTYTQLKAIIVAKSLVYQYTEDSLSYTIFAIEGVISWETRILKDGGADVTDFETNYKAGANVKLYLPMRSDGPVTPGTAALSSQLTGGVYSSTPPTLTNTQQAALQLDVAGNLKENIASWFGSTAPTVGQKTMANALPVVLASDHSLTNPSEIFIAKRIADGTVFSVAADINMATGDAENPVILLRNPAGSGKTIYIRRITYGVSTNNVYIVAKLYKTPTISVNGTTITPQNLLVGSGTASVILATTLPTLSSNGTLVANGSSPQNSSTYPLIDDFYMSVPENQSIALTGTAAGNNRVGSFTVQWVEV